ncbi:MAG: GAF domain-containing protein, partial [bacterium]
MARTEVLFNPERLRALRDTALVGSAWEEAFDRLARVASVALHAPVALVCFVEADRQFFKSCVGLDTERTSSLAYSFCQHVVDRAGPLVVHDASTHLLVAQNRAHVELGMRAYLGVPLTTSDGQTIGSFCVMDREERAWTDEHLAVMTDLAASVMTEIALRAQARLLVTKELTFQSTLERQHEFLSAV